MGWQNVLKSTNSLRDIRVGIEKEYKDWKVHRLSYTNTSLLLVVSKLNRKVDTRIACYVDMVHTMLESRLTGFSRGSPFASVDINYSTEEMNEYIKKVNILLKPTFRSLNWFYEVIDPISDITQDGDGIDVEGESGSNYKILTSEIKSSGCYEVETEEGYRICIEMQDRKPAGDNLLGLTLGLLNDETSSEDIEGLQDYLFNEAYKDCPVCGYENSVNITDEEFICSQCQAKILLTDIRFEPNFDADMDAEEVEGPDGRFEPEYYHHEADLFFMGNKLFTLDDPDNYSLTVYGEPEASLEFTDYGDIYFYDYKPYSENGIEMELDEVRGYISSDDEFFRFVVDVLQMDIIEVYNRLDYENLGGNLWNDGLGGYLDGDGNFTDDIEEIYNLSELSEEDFIMNAIEEWGMDEEEVLNLFDYEEDGKYWTKDEKKYELVDGEMVEQDEGGLTKNLSSKSVLPINMKWTDYLRKNSNTKAEDWESALKSFISDGKKLGIPLSVMELLKLAKEATTSQSEGFETLHRPTFSEEEEEDV